MMTKVERDFFETRAADFLQRVYDRYCRMRNAFGEDSTEARVSWDVYQGNFEMLEAMNIMWDRKFFGDAKNKDELNDPNKYKHFVELPVSDRIKTLNKDLWKS